MKTLPRHLQLSALSMATAVLVAACGGGDATPPPETVPPTINIASNVPGTAVGAVTFTFTFSEDVGGSFTADDVTLSNGAKGTFTKLNALQYTLVVNPAANTAGSIALSIPAASYADLVGNPGVAASASQAFDTLPPDISIVSSAAGTTAKGDVVFSFSFSKDIGTSFTADDVTVSGGSKGAFTVASGTSATLVVSPPANATGTIEVHVPVLAVTDSGGTGNTTAAAAQQPFDTAAPVVATTLVSFEEAVAPVLTGFGGAEDATVVADPTNAANKVGRIVKAANAETWAGTTVSICPNLTLVKLPFSDANKTMSARVWSPDAGIPVRLKVENAADNTQSVETEATTTAAAGWQTLTFNFANPAPGTAALNLANTYDRASIFFNFGKSGATAGGAKTYYLDDLAFIGSSFTVACGNGNDGGAARTTTISFDESTAPGFTGFGGAENASIAADPANAANKVARIVKAADAALWAGTTVWTETGDKIAKIGFSDSAKTITSRVWSPDAGIPVRMKVEDASDASKSVETEATVTVAAGWQTLSFDFANPAAGTAPLNLATTYNRLSVFFNFGKTGADAGGAKTYYLDEIVYPVDTGGDDGGGAPGLVNLVGGVYASNYAQTPAPWRSVEGGNAGRYIDTGVVTQDWWSGLAAADATPSFYFGYGVNSAAKPWGFGGYVSAPNNGVANVAGYSSVQIAVWGNDQLVNTKPNFTVVLKGPEVAGCTSELKGRIAVTGAGVQTYTLPLNGFTLQTACAYASAAAALAAGVKEIHIQVLGDNVQYVSGQDASNNYPNGLNIGPIQFR
jgi:hypothetical protein